MKKPFNKTAIALGVAHLAWMGSAFAQTPDSADAERQTVVITGQRAALQSAQKIKQDADEVVDSIVAEDIGKLPDRSVTEVLQRIPGVVIDRTMARSDPEHFSVEGSGVIVRGLTWVRSELNGRDSFSANGGRSLSFEDVPPELMAGVDVYKNPSAEQIEGGIAGLVNLRTALPFDIKGRKLAASFDYNYSELRKGKANPSGSVLYSDRWKTGLGEFGLLLDFASSDSGTRADTFQVEAYFPRTVAGQPGTVWVPNGAQWRRMEFFRKRQGGYGALQWKLNNDLRSHLTFFKTRYRMQWDEQAIFSSEGNPYQSVISDATFSPAGGILTGTLRSPTGVAGQSFTNDVRTSTKRAETTDVSWNVQWRPTSNWTLTSDLQSVKSKANQFDSTVATSLYIPKQGIDLTGEVPRLTFDQADLDHLANPNNYFWGFTMEHLDRSRADQKTWRGDAKYDFDHPVLRDVRFGVRLTERTSLNENSNPGYNWQGVTQPWMLGWHVDQMAFLGDPRFSGSTSLQTFSNFFGGGHPVPSVVFPDVSLATGYPDTYAKLHSYRTLLCKERDPNCNYVWTPAAFGGENPAGTNDQREKTKAFYTQLRFGFDDLKYPIDGNVGVRYVKTDMAAHGFTSYTPTFNPPAGSLTGVPVPVIPAYANKETSRHTYDNWLPSLNLKMKASEKLQFRLALGSAVARPDFGQLQSYTTLSQNVTSTTDTATNVTNVTQVEHRGTAAGNPMLKPVTSHQLDLTAEWYFAKGGSLTFAAFEKRLKDIVVNQLSTYRLAGANGTPIDFTVTSPVNGARGKARGFELAYQQFYDQLPGWLSGFGVNANYTYVDSRRKLYNPVFSEYCTGTGGVTNLNLNLNGCDTDGRTFGDLPLEYLSRHSANLTLMYEKGPVTARLAYNWRSRYLMGVNNNGTSGGNGTDTNPASPTFGQRNLAWGLPLYADHYGTVDGGIGYKFNEHLRLDFQAQNLTNSMFKQIMHQHFAENGRAYIVSGRRYSLRLGVQF